MAVKDATETVKTSTDKDKLLEASAIISSVINIMMTVCERGIIEQHESIYHAVVETAKAIERMKAGQNFRLSGGGLNHLYVIIEGYALVLENISQKEWAKTCNDLWMRTQIAVKNEPI